MQFIPLYRFELDSISNQHEIANVLKGLSSIYFNGHFSGTHFEYYRIVNYWNGCLPIIKGDIISNGNGSKIKFIMKLNYLGYIFVLIWLFLFLLWLYRFCTIEINKSVELFVPLIISLVSYSLYMISFNYEVYKTKKILRDFIQY